MDRRSQGGNTMKTAQIRAWICMLIGTCSLIGFTIGYWYKGIPIGAGIGLFLSSYIFYSEGIDNLKVDNKEEKQ